MPFRTPLMLASVLLVANACSAPSTNAQDETSSEESQESSSESKIETATDETPSATTTDTNDTNDTNDTANTTTPSDDDDDESSTSTDETSTSDDEQTSSSSSADDETTSDNESSETSDTTSDTTTSDDDNAQENVLQIVISVDWEGMQIGESNIAAMENFRANYPEIPITHFLNAAYFTKPDADPSAIVADTERTLRDHDELGLHIHGWKSLFEAAGVEFRDSPTFWGTVDGCDYDCGHQVTISAYTTEELRKVIAYSLDTLEEQGFGRARSFRSGGWMGRDNVLAALAAQGLERDNSAVATVHFDDEPWNVENLYMWLTQLWADITITSQPYTITTTQGEILEIPDNGGLADYVRGDEMLAVYEACRDYKRDHPTEHVTLNFGFHQETAQQYIGRIDDGLQQIYAAAKADGMIIQPVTSATMKVSR